VIRYPVKIDYIRAEKRVAGEPAWKVIDSTGWPVALCFSDQNAHVIVRAMNELAKVAETETETEAVTAQSETTTQRH
jgi:hypothetical protein